VVAPRPVRPAPRRSIRVGSVNTLWPGSIVRTPPRPGRSASVV
jgi:hypothetical protein